MNNLKIPNRVKKLASITVLANRSDDRAITDYSKYGKTHSEVKKILNEYNKKVAIIKQKAETAIRKANIKDKQSLRDKRDAILEGMHDKLRKQAIRFLAQQDANSDKSQKKLHNNLSSQDGANRSVQEGSKNLGNLSQSEANYGGHALNNLDDKDTDNLLDASLNNSSQVNGEDADKALDNLDKETKKSVLTKVKEWCDKNEKKLDKKVDDWEKEHPNMADVIHITGSLIKHTAALALATLAWLFNSETPAMETDPEKEAEEAFDDDNKPQEGATYDGSPDDDDSDEDDDNTIISTNDTKPDRE